MDQFDAPAGWYPGPDGRKRYWDGYQWLNIPVPEESEVATPAPESPAGVKNRRPRFLVAALVALLLVTLATAGVVVKGNYDAQQAALAAAEEARVREAKAAQEAKEQEEAAVRQKEAEERAAQAAQEQQEALDGAERELRREMVKDIEASIKKMAKKHVKEGLIRGPVLKVSCDPVAGGSIDNLADQTTVFQCFVANKDHGDGTMSGYYYNATMNWDTGSYTYGFGEP